MSLRRIVLLLTVILYSITCGAQGTARIDTVNLWYPTKAEHNNVRLYCYVPDHPCGAAAIVCPGGSYCWLDLQEEGFRVAEWLNSQGITAFVLHYRTIGFGAYYWHHRFVARGTRHPDMLFDFQLAMQWIHAYADKYGVDRDRIGAVGFSAGGHLAMAAACFSTTSFLESEGVPATVNLCPAFIVPVYPVVTMREPFVHKRSRRALLGENHQWNKVMIDSLSLELHIPQDCPPVFIVNCKDDDVVDFRNSVLLDSALTAAGVRHVYRQYRHGGHGFGVNDSLGSDECRRWKLELMEWLKGMDIIK